MIKLHKLQICDSIKITACDILHSLLERSIAQFG